MDIIDSLDAISLPKGKEVASSSKSGLGRTILSWLSAWEIYPIIAVAVFLHFYGLTTTEFDADQAIMARMPYNAVVHGLIPATGTISSIGMVNPPGYFYFMMPVAAFTANPLANVIFTASLNIIAVILTYAFTRRYYGRLAGTVAALLYTTTFQDVFFGRFIWQPNLLPLFVILFMWTLFRGAVERKPGWLAAALALMGFMLQLHATPAYLAIPLALALALAYKTVRWRDLVIGLSWVALMFSTYVVWEISTHFADIRILLGASHNPAHFDSQALHLYLNFLVPYVIAPYFPWSNNPQDLFYHVVPLLHWGRWAMYAVTCGGFLVAGLGLFGWQRIQLMSRTHFPEGNFRVIAETSLFPWQNLRHWWNAFGASPQRCSLLLLLSWQIPPLLIISRHTIPLQFQYFMFFLPGPFILIGLLFNQMTSWSRQIKNWGRFLRLFVPALSLLLVLLQFTGSFGWFFDEVHGYHPQGAGSNTLQDAQGAIDAADHLAQSHHLQHVYIDTDISTYETLKYLAGQMQTPATVLNGSHCLVLPSLAQGPAVMLIGPENTLDRALLEHFASVSLVGEPSRLGGAPYHLYIVQPLPGMPDNQGSFTNMLKLNKSQPDSFAWHDPTSPNGTASRLLETSWTNLKSLPDAYGTLYTYHFAAQYTGKGLDGATGSADCSFTNLAPSDQLLVPFQLPQGSSIQPTSLAVSGSSWLTQPYELHYGPFHFESILDQKTTAIPFQTFSGGESIVVQNKSQR